MDSNEIIRAYEEIKAEEVLRRLEQAKGRAEFMWLLCNTIPHVKYAFNLN
uniref:Uncharacterized protein n=1 Tax=viral metagenome TaxID=1070528 RepID=A0A6M3LTX8_9ZZZZ